MSFLHTLENERSVMRKEMFPFFLLLIVIIVLVCSIWSFQRQIDDARERASNLEAQLSDLQNPTYNVTITNVTSTNWYFPAGMAYSKRFDITIKNIGDRDFGGLTIEFKILTNGNVTENEDFSVSLVSPKQLGVLHVQESTAIGVGVLTNFSVSRAGKSLVVTLMLDGVVMDECELSLATWEGF
jgi:hypothetical protein